MAMERIIKNTNNFQGEALGIFKGLALGIALCALLLPSIVSAGVIRKPPNNLGLTAYWNFDEGNGTLVGDFSGNKRNGTLMGSPIPTWTIGKFGNALLFNGVTPDTQNQVELLSTLSLTNTHTVSMWLYLNGNCTGPYGINLAALFSAGPDGGLYCDYSTSSNKINYLYSVDNHFNNTALSLGRWYHIAVVNNAGSATFYLNGVADGTASSAPGYDAYTIGSDDFANEALAGKIDEVRVYNRALSATEILALYKSGSAKIGLSNSSPGTLKNGLTGHWTFDGKDMVSNVADVSGNGRHGYLTNFTSTTTTIGKIGQAVKFDGSTNKYIQTTGNNWSNFITATDGTISAWVRPQGASPSCQTNFTWNCSLAVSNNATLYGFGIARGENTDFGGDKIWATNSVNSNSDQATGVDYDLGEWVHITWVHTGGTLSIYKNGEFASSTPSGNTNTSILNTALWIGRSWNGSANVWNGDLDDIRTWNRALTASEIKQVYNIGAGQKVSTTKTPVGTLQTGLVGYWTFDGKDMVSNVADVSGSGNNGTLTSFTSTTTAIGKIGQALTFNLNKSVSIPDNASLNMTSAMSVAGWVFPIDITASSFPSLVSKDHNSQWAFILDYEEAGLFGNQIRAIVNIAGTRRDCYVTSNLANNQWQHVAFTYNGNEIIIYKDGVSLAGANCTWAGSIGTSSSSLLIGKLAAYAGFIGSIDDVRIYNRALSVSEVKQLYNLGK